MCCLAWWKKTLQNVCVNWKSLMCVHNFVFIKHVLGWRFDLLAILQPFDLDIRINYLTPQDNLLALFHRVARFKLLQESWDCRQKGKGINEDWTTHQFMKTFLLLFSLSNFMVSFLFFMPLPCCTSISTSPEVKSHFPVQFLHTSNASLLHSLYSSPELTYPRYAWARPSSFSDVSACPSGQWCHT